MEFDRYAFRIEAKESAGQDLSPRGRSNDNYKILISWSVSLNNFGMIKKRLEKLFEQINSKDNRFIIIGMNLDPVRS